MSNIYCHCSDCKERRLVNANARIDLKKLKGKGKRLYALLYIPTGEYIQWSDDPTNITIPRNYTVEAMVERVNDPQRTSNPQSWKFTSAYEIIQRNEIVLPSIPQHYEKVELNYR
jgi:hypothetical protein